MKVMQQQAQIQTILMEQGLPHTFGPKAQKKGNFFQQDQMLIVL